MSGKICGIVFGYLDTYPEAMLEFISNGKIPSNIREKAIDLIDLADRYDLQVSNFL